MSNKLLRHILPTVLISSLMIISCKADALSKTEWTVKDYYCPVGCIGYDEDLGKSLLGTKVTLSANGQSGPPRIVPCDSGSLELSSRRVAVDVPVAMFNSMIPVESKTNSTNDPEFKSAEATPENTRLNRDAQGNPRSHLIMGFMKCNSPTDHNEAAVTLWSIEDERLIALVSDSVFIELH